jgi:hypothetical protein
MSLDANPFAVTLLTASLEVQGKIFLPSNAKDNRRLTEFFNNNQARRFITVTQVSVRKRDTGALLIDEHPYIQLSMNAIEAVIPVTFDETTGDA